MDTTRYPQGSPDLFREICQQHTRVVAMCKPGDKHQTVGATLLSSAAWIAEEFGAIPSVADALRGAVSNVRTNLNADDECTAYQLRETARVLIEEARLQARMHAGEREVPA